MNLVRFWHALESVPGLRALRVQWEEHLGPEIEVIGRLLRTTSERVERYPCATWVGDGCPRIVDVDGGVAFCGNLPPVCEDIPLQKGDVLIREVDLSELIRQIANGLSLLAADPIRGARAPGRWRIGTYGQTHGPDLPVHLLIQRDRDGFYRAAAESLADANGRLLLLAPTSRWLDARLLELVRGRGSWLLALADLLEIGKSGMLAAKVPLNDALAALRSPVGPAENVFEEIVDGWSIRFRGEDKKFHDLLGLRLLRVLLQNPGEDFDPLELAGAAGELRLPDAVEQSERALEGEDGLDTGRSRSRSDPRSAARRSRRDDGIVDEQAEQAPTDEWVRGKLLVVRRRLAAAKAKVDLKTVEILGNEEKELTALLGSLAKPYPSAPRRSEWQRLTKALQFSLSKIRTRLPTFGTHLDQALVRGPRWQYRKDLWRFRTLCG